MFCSSKLEEAEWVEVTTTGRKRMGGRRRLLVKDVVVVCFSLGACYSVYSARRTAQREMKTSSSLRSQNQAYARNVAARRLDEERAAASALKLT